MPCDKPCIKSLPSGIESIRDRILFVAKTTPVMPLIRDVYTFCRRSWDRIFTLKLSHMSWLTFTFVRASQLWGRAVRSIFSCSLSSAIPLVSKLVTIAESSLSIESPTSSDLKSCLMLSRTAFLGSSLKGFDTRVFPLFLLFARWLFWLTEF